MFENYGDHRKPQLPGGWEGVRLTTDRREDGCGNDFLCLMANREAKLEVKTFVHDGRVVVTTEELREAATSTSDYYLVGVLDDSKPENEWPSVVHFRRETFVL